MKTVVAFLAVSVLLGAFAVPAMKNYSATQQAVAQQPRAMPGVVWTSRDAGVLVESGEWFCIIPNSGAQYRIADASARQAFISQFGPTAQAEWTQQACGVASKPKTAGNPFDRLIQFVGLLIIGKLTFWVAVAVQFIIAVGLMALMAIKKASDTAVIAVGVLAAYVVGVWQLGALILVEIGPILFFLIVYAAIKAGVGINFARVALGDGRNTATQLRIGSGQIEAPVPLSLANNVADIERASTPIVISTAPVPTQPQLPASRRIVEADVW